APSGSSGPASRRLGPARPRPALIASSGPRTTRYPGHRRSPALDRRPAV
ncbi:MAG: hypothetical protein AVDCRST_MAG59-395, partial [uncultured Thermomicrobiales bacterium]